MGLILVISLLMAAGSFAFAVLFFVCARVLMKKPHSPSVHPTGRKAGAALLFLFSALCVAAGVFMGFAAIEIFRAMCDIF